jgi:hypothetical protein
MPTIRTVDGGNLIADLDPISIGPTNCTVRRNIRREDDAEILFPGWARYAADLPAPIIHLHRATRPNGERALLAFTATDVYRLLDDGTWEVIWSTVTVATEWEAVDKDGVVVLNNKVDLLARWEWTGPAEPIWELREQGIARVNHIASGYDFLLLAGVTEINAGDLKAWMNRDDVDVYGAVIPEEILTATPYRLAWSDDPDKWRLGVGALLRKNEAALDFPCRSLSVGDKVNFVETLEDDDDLTVILTEATITAIAGNRLTLDQTADADSTGFLVRSDYSAQIVGYDDLQGEGDAILHVQLLAGILVVVKESTVVIGQLTEESGSPFVFDEIYRGLLAPTSKRLIAASGNRSLLWYSRNAWYEFNLSSRRPERIRAFDLNETLFTQLSEQTSVAVNMEPDEEIWILLPDRTLVYDYGNQILSELDATFTAACIADDDDERVLLLAHGKTVYQLRSDLATRDGNTYEGILQYGWIGDTNAMRDTLLLKYIPQGRYGNRVEVSIQKITTGATDPVLVLSKEVDVGREVRLYSRSQWFQETIRIKDGTTRLIGREIELITAKNSARGYTRAAS